MHGHNYHRTYSMRLLRLPNSWAGGRRIQSRSFEEKLLVPHCANSAEKGGAAERDAVFGQVSEVSRICGVSASPKQLENSATSTNGQAGFIGWILGIEIRQGGLSPDFPLCSYPPLSHWTPKLLARESLDPNTHLVRLWRVNGGVQVSNPHFLLLLLLLLPPSPPSPPQYRGTLST